jgi:UDPglucose 6-dehydrogenase
MIDINSKDFIADFMTSDATVGIVGHGYVGKALEHFFKKSDMTVLVNDVAELDSFTLDYLVENAEVVFVAVPTPMKETGECYTGIVREVLDDIVRTARIVNRPLDKFIVVVKSTVPPGFTESVWSDHPDLRLCFSPEFLTEKNSFEDFDTQNRIIVGGDDVDSPVVLKYFQSVVPSRVEDGTLLLLQCHPTLAETVKLYANGILATKVMFSNEVYQLCQVLAIDYSDVRELACLDARIGSGHTVVPGPDGQLGFGGHCFPKDLQNLRYVMKQHGVKERVLSAVIDRNLELREDRDWERMKGRAVVSSSHE